MNLSIDVVAECPKCGEGDIALMDFDVSGGGFCAWLEKWMKNETAFLQVSCECGHEFTVCTKEVEW